MPTLSQGSSLEAHAGTLACLPPIVMFVAKAFQRPDIPRARQEAETLLRAGYPVFVFAWDRYSEFPPRDNVDGAVVCSFNRTKLGRFPRLGLALGGIIFQIVTLLGTLRLIRHLKQRPIVHAHDINTLLPGLLLRITGLCCGLVYDCRELTYGVYSEWFHPLLGAMLRILEERCLPHVDAIITVSDPIASYLRRFNPTTDVIYNCVRSDDIPRVSKREARIRLGLHPDIFTISYVGTLRYDSRLDLLLSVASLIENDNLRFVVVGSGPLASEFEKAARKMLDAPLFVFPQVPRETALLYITASDLCWVVYQNPRLSLNSRVAMPWKFLESLACGTPVIVERGSLRAQLVSKLKCGLVLESDAPDHVYRALTSLAGDAARMQGMRIGAREAAEQTYRWEAMAHRLLNVYKGLRPMENSRRQLLAKAT